MNGLDKNGFSIKMDVSIRFHPAYQKIGYLHEYFGKDYINQLIIPEVWSTVRRVMGRYTAEEVYSTKRSEVETAIINETEEILQNESNNVQMRALLIRSINLPEQINSPLETNSSKSRKHGLINSACKGNIAKLNGRKLQPRAKQKLIVLSTTV